MRWRACIAALLLALAPVVVSAQDDLALGQLRSAILTIDADRLLAETLFGRRIAAEIRERSEALAAENAALAEQLQTEERSLTARRPTMEIEDFRAEAEAFDERVQRIRAAQDAKQAALETDLAQGRQTLLNAASPVLAQLMIDSGAVVILERREVFLSTGLVDITDEAIEAIDVQLGDGRTAGRPAAVDPTVSPGAEAPSETGAGGQNSILNDMQQPSDATPFVALPGTEDPGAGLPGSDATEPADGND